MATKNRLTQIVYTNAVSSLSPNITSPPDFFNLLTSCTI